MKGLPQQLSSLCSPFGKILSVTVLHGRGQALVEMESFAAVDNFLIWALSTQGATQSSLVISGQLTGGNENDDEEKHRNRGNRLIGDKVEVNSSALDCSRNENFNLKFSNWSQCALVERGKQRENHIIVDISSETCLGKMTNDNDTKNDKAYSNYGDNDDNHIIENAAVSSTAIMKDLNHDTILIEDKRSMAVLIRKIITLDSRDRMVARKLRKKNHKKLIDNLGNARFSNEDENDVSEMIDNNFHQNNNKSNCNNDNNINNYSKITNIKKDDINIVENKYSKDKNISINSKSHFFLSDWKNNKYCLNKKELKSICWPYVVAGGKLEFCPYYKTNMEDIINTDGNNFEDRKTEIGNGNEKNIDDKTKIENSDNSINFGAKSSNSSDIKPNIEGNYTFICPLLHISRPITEVPTELRIFEIEDFFPIVRCEICYIDYYLLFIICCLLCVVYYVLFIMCCLLCVIYYVLFI